MATPTFLIFEKLMRFPSMCVGRASNIPTNSFKAMPIYGTRGGSALKWEEYQLKEMCRHTGQVTF